MHCLQRRLMSRQRVISLHIRAYDHACPLHARRLRAMSEIVRLPESPTSRTRTCMTRGHAWAWVVRCRAIAR